MGSERPRVRGGSPCGIPSSCRGREAERGSACRLSRPFCGPFWTTSRWTSPEKPRNNNTLCVVAETKGFEPSRRFPAYSLSRGAPSTTRPRLRRRSYRPAHGRHKGKVGPGGLLRGGERFHQGGHDAHAVGQLEVEQHPTRARIGTLRPGEELQSAGSQVRAEFDVIAALSAVAALHEFGVQSELQLGVRGRCGEPGGRFGIDGEFRE